MRKGLVVAIGTLASVAFAAGGQGGTVSRSSLQVGQAVAKEVAMTFNGLKSNARTQYVQASVRITAVSESDRAKLKKLWSAGNQTICRSTIEGDPSWSSDPKNSRKAAPPGALVRDPDLSFRFLTAYCVFPTDRDEHRGRLMRGTIIVLDESREYRRSFAVKLLGKAKAPTSPQPAPPPTRRANPSCSNGGSKDYSLGANERMKVFVVDQFGCMLWVKDYCAIRTAKYDAGKGDLFVQRECPPDDEVGEYRVYEGELPMNSSSFPNSAANLSLKILRIGAAGYPGPPNQVLGRCTTSQKFPVMFDSPGRKFIRYRCA